MGSTLRKISEIGKNWQKSDSNLIWNYFEERFRPSYRQWIFWLLLQRIDHLFTIFTRSDGLNDCSLTFANLHIPAFDQSVTKDLLFFLFLTIPPQLIIAPKYWVEFPLAVGFFRKVCVLAAQCCGQILPQCVCQCPPLPKSNNCNQCDYASSDASTLKTHLKRHTGEKAVQ